jgi:hypothetical protein
MAIIINSHMAVIQVQIGKKTIEDALLDGGSRVNIITKQLKLKLGLLKPKPAPYNLKMSNQTITKLMILICDLKIYVHYIPYVITFIVLQNSVIDTNYSMLLRRPWLRDDKVTHDWGNNTMTIQGNGMVRIIVMTKHMGIKVKQPEMLLCYNYQNGITNEEEDIIFPIKPKLFPYALLIY